MSNPLQSFIDWLGGTSVYLTPIVTVTLSSAMLTRQNCTDNIQTKHLPTSPLVYHGSAKVASGGSALSVAAVYKDPNSNIEWGFDTPLTWNGSNVELTGLDFAAPDPLVFGDPYHYGCRVLKSFLRDATVTNNGETLELDIGIYYQQQLVLGPGTEDVACKLLLQRGFLISNPLPIHLP
ncbi:MAG TPA: hypothetical protein VIH89_17375 [Candidatus Sulfotelmatobacter sp.]